MKLFEFLGELALSDHSEVAEKMQGMYRAVAEFSEKVMNLYDGLNTWWEDTGAHLCEVILQLTDPHYDEVTRQKLIDCYKGWGQYGWTCNSEVNSTIFDKLPATPSEADEVMQQYCTTENVASMLHSIAERGVNQQDLNEAFQCYKAGMYKASALILFALIDHELITMDYRKPPRRGEAQGWRKTGEKAVMAYRDEHQPKGEESVLFNYLWFLNIVEALLTLMADGDDFQNEPDMINRNFVSHGMSQRIVKEIDCFKVWSALYTLTAILPTLEESFE